MNKIQVRRRRILPWLSSIAFGVSLALVITNNPWGIAMAIAIYLLALSIALEKTGF